jgi:lysozyme
MQVSENGVALVKHFEGFQATAYLCPANVPTIGYGHTKSVMRSDVGKETITEAEAAKMLVDDLAEFAQQVEAAVTVPLNQDQFDALCSFAYNLGVQALRSSTLLSRLNAGAYDSVPDQLMRWTHGGGQVLQGLVRRRTAEAKLWNSEAWV